MAVSALFSLRPSMDAKAAKRGGKQICMKISETLSIDDSEIDIRAVRSHGSGGQHVNKVATAIHLRFDIHASSLPDGCKIRLLSLQDRRITGEGVIVIKADRYRTQWQNRREACNRLKTLVQEALAVQKARKATRPTSRSKEKRLDDKAHRSAVKRMRKKVDE